MMETHLYLRDLAVVLCAAAVTTVVSRRLRLPAVFGYVLAGMIVGPYVPIPLAVDRDMVVEFSELGVVLLMYALGLEFRLGQVMRVAATSGLAALAESSVMFALGFTAGSLFGWTTLESLVAGAMVAISSTTIVTRTFAEQRVTGVVRDTVFGILIVEDVIAILLITLLTTLVSGAGLSGRELAVAGLRLVTFLVVLIAVGRVTVPRFVRAVHRLGSPETTVVASIGISFAAALLALSFGYSVALGAFIAGSLVAESGLGKEIEQLIVPVRDLFVAIFFVSVGMAIDPRVVRDWWGPILAFAVLVMVGKMVAVSVGAFLTGRNLRDSVKSGMSMAQIGEFSFIIAGVGATNEATRPFLYPMAVTVSALTTLMTPWLVRASGPVAARVDRGLPPALQTYVALYGSWFARLTSGQGGREHGLRRAVWLIVADVAALAVLIMAAAAEMGRLAVLVEGWTGWGPPAGSWMVVALALVGSLPFVAGTVRMTRTVARTLARRAMPLPAAGKLDRAFAPRAAFVATLHLAMLATCALPLVALILPLAPGAITGGALATLGVVMILVVWRSARALYDHSLAGAEVIVMALTQHDRTRGSEQELARTMGHVATLLPGLGDPVSLRLHPGDPGVGRTLEDLDLRGGAGAEILAILRSDGTAMQSVRPTGPTRLEIGDVLAIAGSRESLLAARELLVSPREESVAAGRDDPNAGGSAPPHPARTPS
ncbi:MAG: cation:proton antiporter [Gemmatimonadaceae bacterium]|nr:cation:proton antiporter [Gemmatimonadaceae bacterium]